MNGRCEDRRSINCSYEGSECLWSGRRKSEEWEQMTKSSPRDTWSHAELRADVLNVSYSASSGAAVAICIDAPVHVYIP